MKNVWEFVEKYYPNYYQCDDILIHDYLQVIVDNEEIEGSGAFDLYQTIAEEFKHIDFMCDKDKDIFIRAKVLERLNSSSLEIYEKAIENFLTLNNN